MESNFEPVKTFKRCALCGKEWATRGEFLADKDLRLEGYQWDRSQVMVGLPSEGVLVFTHSCEACGTSMMLPARLFGRNGEQYGETQSG